MRLTALVPAVLGFLSFAASAPYANDSDETRQLVPMARGQDPVAMEKLGDIYSEGKGVRADRTEAINWYAFASDLGNLSARQKLWELEGHLTQPLPKVKRAKQYKAEVTQDLCRYLYLASKGPNALINPGDLPKGMIAKPSPAPGKVMAPSYEPSVVKRYLAKGADPNASIRVEELRIQGSSGTTIRPFLYVARQKDYKTMDLLIAHGCCLHDGGKAVFYAAFNDMQGNTGKKPSDKMVKYLLARGADFGIRSNWGSTCIMECSIFDLTNGIAWLAAQGHDVNATLDPRYSLGKKAAATGENALTIAVRNRRVNALNALIKAGADLNRVVEGKTILDVALQHGPVKNDRASGTYEQELNRLRAVMYPRPGAPYRPAGKLSFVHLLRLSGAKYASELPAAGSLEENAK